MAISYFVMHISLLFKEFINIFELVLSFNIKLIGSDMHKFYAIFFKILHAFFKWFVNNWLCIVWVSQNHFINHFLRIVDNSIMCYQFSYFHKSLLNKNVDKLQTLEPSSNNISQTSCTNNLCVEMISLMKQSTQEYYNMRMILDLECA